MTNFAKILFVIIILAAVGAAYYFFLPAKENPAGNFCTEEALLCPDGSYTARSGPECKFTACAGAGPFEGKLVLQGENVRLIIASPDQNGQEVTFALPLEMNFSDAVKLAGQYVKVTGKFTEGINFRVESAENAQADLSMGELKAGETRFINGVRITLNKIVSDSRCPAGVQCVWAGSVTAEVILKSDTDKETINIESGKAAAFDSFLVSLENVKPAKTQTDIAQKEYILTFKVVSNARD